MAYASFQGGQTSPYWFAGSYPYQDEFGLDPTTPESSVMTGLQSRLTSLEDAGNWLKDVKAPNVTPYTPVTTNLGRVASLRDFISSGDTAKVDSEMRRAVTMAQNKPQPEAAFTLGKVAEGYGKSKSDIMSGAYKTAQQMHVGEVNAENSALASQYEMNLKNAQYQYDLDMKKAMAAETERTSLLDMMDKLRLSSVKQPTSAISSPLAKQSSMNLGASSINTSKSLTEAMKELESILGGGVKTIYGNGYDSGYDSGYGGESLGSSISTQENEEINDAIKSGKAKPVMANNSLNTGYSSKDSYLYPNSNTWWG